MNKVINLSWPLKTGSFESEEAIGERRGQRVLEAECDVTFLVDAWLTSDLIIINQFEFVSVRDEFIAMTYLNLHPGFVQREVIFFGPGLACLFHKRHRIQLDEGMVDQLVHVILRCDVHLEYFSLTSSDGEVTLDAFQA